MLVFLCPLLFIISIKACLVYTNDYICILYIQRVFYHFNSSHAVELQTVKVSFLWVIGVLHSFSIIQHYL